MKSFPLFLLAIFAVVALLAAAFPAEAHVLAIGQWNHSMVFHYCAFASLGHVVMAIGAAVPLWTGPTSKAIRGLQQKKHAVAEQMQTMAAAVGDRQFTPEEQARWAQLKASRDDYERQIDEQVGIIRREARLDEPYIDIARRGASGNVRSYAAMFGAPGASEFSSLGEMVSLIHGGLSDQRLLAAVAGGSEGVGADGGFLIPPQFAATLLDASLESEIVRPRARIEPMLYSSKTVAGLDTQDHSVDIGGLTGKWLGEGGSMAAQKPRLRALILTAQKLGILLPMSNEWVADAPDADGQISRALIAAIGWWLDYGFLNGTGAGQPKGVLNDAALIVANAEGGQAAATITYENIKAMYARLHPAAVPNAVWIANQGARAQLLGLIQAVKNAAGTDFVGGSGVPIVKQGADGSMSLLGLPLLFTEKVPALGTQGDIVLADLSQYVVGLRQEISIAKSQHLYFDSDQTAYRVLLRADGRGTWSKAMTPKNGATLSWCVTLAAR